MAYIKQTWVDKETPLDAEHLNHIEEGINSNAEATAQNAEKIGELDEKMIPETAAPHQQLVTDKNGATKWEERTHYAEEEVVVVYENALAGDGSIALTNATVPLNSSKFIVTFDGDTYEFDVKPRRYIVAREIGDENVQSLGPNASVTDYEYPFYIRIIPDNNNELNLIEIITWDAQPHNVTVECKVETVAKMDPKYIPSKLYINHGKGGTHKWNPESRLWEEGVSARDFIDAFRHGTVIITMETNYTMLNPDTGFQGEYTALSYTYVGDYIYVYFYTGTAFASVQLYW